MHRIRLYVPSSLLSASLLRLQEGGKGMTRPPPAISPRPTYLLQWASHREIEEGQQRRGSTPSSLTSWKKMGGKKRPSTWSHSWPSWSAGPVFTLLHRNHPSPPHPHPHSTPSPSSPHPWGASPSQEHYPLPLLLLSRSSLLPAPPPCPPPCPPSLLTPAGKNGNSRTTST